MQRLPQLCSCKKKKRGAAAFGKMFSKLRTKSGKYPEQIRQTIYTNPINRFFTETVPRFYRKPTGTFPKIYRKYSEKNG
jgi:hypothetical protein